MSDKQSKRKALGLVLRQLRKRRGLTLNEAGKQIGLSASFLSDIERGKSSPSLDNLEKLAVFYKMTTRELVSQRATQARPANKYHVGDHFVHPQTRETQQLFRVYWDGVQYLYQIGWGHTLTERELDEYVKVEIVEEEQR